jgi:hypothetical protein
VFFSVIAVFVGHFFSRHNMVAMFTPHDSAQELIDLASPSRSRSRTAEEFQDCSFLDAHRQFSGL